MHPYSGFGFYVTSAVFFADLADESFVIKGNINVWHSSLSG
jgi:hypothetical protein